jgi:hypothetical protein
LISLIERNDLDAIELYNQIVPSLNRMMDARLAEELSEAFQKMDWGGALKILLSF